MVSHLGLHLIVGLFEDEAARNVCIVLKFLDAEIVADGKIGMLFERIGIDKECQPRHTCARAFGFLGAVAGHPEFIFRCAAVLVLRLRGREIGFRLHRLVAVPRIQPCCRADKCGIVVDGDLVVNIIGGNVLVLVFRIRAAHKCAPENVLLVGSVLCHGQTGRSAVVREFRRIVAVADHIAAVDGVVAEQIFHLSACPVGEIVIRMGRVIQILALLVFVIDQTGELRGGVITRRTPGIQPEIARRGDLAGFSVHKGVAGFGFHFPEVQNLVGASADGNAAFLAHLRINVLDASPDDAHAVPHVIPAQHITGRGVVIDIGQRLFEVPVIFCDEVQPARRKAEIILPL